jgi:hypothetical protein
MNRYADSKIPELDQHVDNIENRMGWVEEKVRELKRVDDEIKEVKVVELAFKDKCEHGVADVNRLLEKKFEIFWKQPTESGYVFFMAKWGLKEL